MSDITMGKLNVLADLTDADLFDADGNVKVGEKTVIRKNEKINLCAKIEGAGLNLLKDMAFLEPVDPADPTKGNKAKQDSSGKDLAARWTVSYFAESFGPGSNDVVLGTKEGSLVLGEQPKNDTISQKETTARIDLTNVQDKGDGSSGPIKPGVYKMTAVVQWARGKDKPISGHAAFTEGGTVEVTNE